MSSDEIHTLATKGRVRFKTKVQNKYKKYDPIKTPYWDMYLFFNPYKLIIRTVTQFKLKL